MAIRVASLLALLVLAALPPATTAARRLNLAPLARTKPLHQGRNLTPAAKKPAVKASAAAKGAKEPAEARAVEVHPATRAVRAPEPVDAQGPVLVVEEVPVMQVVEEVPVMQIVIARDGREGMPPFEDSGLFAERRQGPPMGASDGISGSCKQEMMRFQTNKTRLEHAQACEDKSNNSQRALQALQRANVSAASAATAETFHGCGGISKGCAEQVAPHIVLAIRLSGAAVSQTCAKAANDGPPKQAAQGAKSCQRNTTQSMVRALATRDMQGCLLAAEHGLRACQGIKPPCDFQLAPLLVAHVLEAAEAASAPQQVTEVLLAGVRAAAELTQEMMAEEATVTAARGNASHAASKTEAPHPPARGAAGEAAPAKAATKPAPPKKAASARVTDASPAKPAAKSASPEKTVLAKGRKAISLIDVASRARVLPARGPLRF